MARMLNSPPSFTRCPCCHEFNGSSARASEKSVVDREIQEELAIMEAEYREFLDYLDNDW